MSGDIRDAAAVGSGSPLTYAEALRSLEARGRFGIRLGLGRVRALLHELGDPQLGVRGALVAGTNGKGSVIALAGSALRAAGYRVGETPKPHLVTYRERIVVDGRPIAPDAFAALAASVLPLADRVSRRLGPPTEFELLTAMMFRHFAASSLDVALVEVGLGGRLDATHAWDGGVAVLTNVDLDHTDRLGTTIEAIAREKAAIIERGDRAVTGAVEPALAIVRRRCRRLGVPLIEAPSAELLGWDRDRLRVRLAGLGEVEVGLRGRHQAANVAVADALLDALEAAGIATVPPAARREGYATARWPGRLELVEVDDAAGAPREVLLDGAHNPAGAAALAAALDDLRPYLGGGARSAWSAGGALSGLGGTTPGTRQAPLPLTVVWASMADKDVEGTVGAVAASRALAGATIVCTAVDTPRALDAVALAAVWRRRRPDATIRTAANPAAALDIALEAGRGPVIVAGSLYLVGAARARLIDDPTLRDPVAA